MRNFRMSKYAKTEYYEKIQKLKKEYEDLNYYVYTNKKLDSAYATINGIYLRFSNHKNQTTQITQNDCLKLKRPITIFVRSKFNIPSKIKEYLNK